MRFYKVDDSCGAVFCGTIAEAHATAKGGSFNKLYVEIEEVEVPTDKAGVLDILNTNPGELQFKALRKWCLTPRGGLQEEKPDA